MIDQLRQFANRFRAFFTGAQLDADLDAEMASHVDLAIEENIQRGMSPEEARRQALIRFGGVEQAKQTHRETRGLPFLEILLQDLRFTFRSLHRDKVFTTVAVLILALGIGANIAVFSVVNTILLRPLPFPQSHQLVRILSKKAVGGESGMTYSADAMEAFQQSNHSFQAVAGYYAFTGDDNIKLIGSGQPIPVTGLPVSSNFFQTLEVSPSLGRLFTAQECQHNAAPVVLLGNSFWRRQFASDRSIVGKTVNFDGHLVTVVGVLPDDFDFGAVFSPGAKIDVFIPNIMDDIRGQGNTMALIGRLKPGVTLPQAQAEADILFPTFYFMASHPDWGKGYTGRLWDLKEYVSGKLKHSLVVLWCAVGLILLIVCVNLSNLLLARSAARSKEFAMRTALGAGRGRLVRQMLTESIVLSGIGAVLGLGIAFATTTYLAHQKSIALPLLNNVRIDGAALGWTLAVAIVAAFFFGLVPALKTSSGNLVETLKDSGIGATAARKHDRMRTALVISEVALACVLLVGAGLLLRSFLRILDVDLGFQPSHAAAISVDYNDGDNEEKRGAIWREVIQRVEAIPGVDIAGISDNLPMSRNRSWGIAPKGFDRTKEALEGTFVYMISPGYLRAIGMRLVAGRDVSWDDGPKSERVVIINETIARRFWPGENAVGKLATVNERDTRVIAVVADVRESSVEGTPGWQMYLPATQFGPEGANLVIRTKLPVEELASPVMSTLRQINPAQPAVAFRPIQQLVDHAVSPRRFFVILVVSFATLGLVLAALGIYGVISYSVTQRTQEIGIRMALGATPAQVQLDVIWKTLRLALAGMLAGIVVSLQVARLIATLLFGTAPTDPITFAGMILLLGIVALVAGYVPARRAAETNPMVALRNN
jgi:predicted permease